MRTRSPRHLAIALALLAAVAPAVPVLVAGPAAAVSTDLAAGPPGVTWGATIDGHDVGSATGNNPVALPAGRDVRVDLAVKNEGPDTLTIRAIRLEGRVLGMSFYSFTTQVNLVVPPGATEDRGITLDLGELGDQAVGLIPAHLSLLAQDRSVVARQALATDVRGSIISAYGLFGLAVGGITLVLLLGLALEIAQHRLPVNRWRRGVRFLAPGFGLGLTATFTLSATRMLIPGAAVWVPLVLGFGGIAFLVGYFSPGPREDEHLDETQYERPGYAGESPRALDPYAPQPALAQHAPPPALEEPARQPGLDAYSPGLLPGRHRDPDAPDVVELPDPDRDRQGLLP